MLYLNMTTMLAVCCRSLLACIGAPKFGSIMLLEVCLCTGTAAGAQSNFYSKSLVVVNVINIRATNDVCFVLNCNIFFL